MQKKNKNIPKSALIVRGTILVFTSNILLLALISIFEPENDSLKCIEQTKLTSEVYFKLAADIKTRFEVGKEVIIIDPKMSLLATATLWEQRLEEFSHDSELPRNMYIVSTSQEQLPVLYQMKNAEILPSSFQKNLLAKTNKRNNKKRRSYEISY